MRIIANAIPVFAMTALLRGISILAETDYGSSRFIISKAGTEAFTGKATMAVISILASIVMLGIQKVSTTSEIYRSISNLSQIGLLTNYCALFRQGRQSSSNRGRCLFFNITISASSIFYDKRKI
jgi:hypothetical protein